MQAGSRPSIIRQLRPRDVEAFLATLEVVGLTARRSEAAGVGMGWQPPDLLLPSTLGMQCLPSHGIQVQWPLSFPLCSEHFQMASFSSSSY